MNEGGRLPPCLLPACLTPTPLTLPYKLSAYIAASALREWPEECCWCRSAHRGARPKVCHVGRPLSVALLQVSGFIGRAVLLLLFGTATSPLAAMCVALSSTAPPCSLPLAVLLRCPHHGRLGCSPLGLFSSRGLVQVALPPPPLARCWPSQALPERNASLREFRRRRLRRQLLRGGAAARRHARGVGASFSAGTRATETTTAAQNRGWCRTVRLRCIVWQAC